MPRKDREARNAYMRDYNARNPLPQRARVAARKKLIRQENRGTIAQAKDRPCADCGNRFPSYVMDFDHVRGTKRFDIGNHTQVMPSPAQLAAEIAKCDVVCSNCHRIRTHAPT